MSDKISVMSRTQIIYVEPASGAVSVIYVGPMGPPGPPGSGEPGPPGDAGVGVPTGGTTGQVLTKDTATDYDTSWQTPSGGGSGLPIHDSDSSADFDIAASPDSEPGNWYASAVGNNDVAGSGYRAAQLTLRGDANSDGKAAVADLSAASSNGVSDSGQAYLQLFTDKTTPLTSQAVLLAGNGFRQSGFRVHRDGVQLFMQLDGTAPAPVFDMNEVLSAPANPPANQARLFARDNGSGKTQLCVRFPTGAVIVLATEP